MTTPYLKKYSENTFQPQEKLLPQNIEAEEGVLGSIIIDPDAYYAVADLLTAEDFYRDAHKSIYEAIVTIVARGTVPDFITICDELERQEKLNGIGGPSYITSLINQVPTSGNVVYYAKVVERTAFNRRSIHAAGEIATIASQDGDDTLQQIQSLVLGLVRRGDRTDTTRLSDGMNEWMLRLDQKNERRKENKDLVTGVTSGYKDLDRITEGFQKQDLIVLAARTAMGKCLPSYTLIDDPLTGRRRTIEECVRQQIPMVQSLSEDGLIHITPVSHWTDNGIKPCFRLTTRLGRTIDATANHPFLTVEGWEPLERLFVGSTIALPTKVEAFGNDESFSHEEIRLLAYFIAEGALTGDTPGFTNTDPIIINDFQDCITKRFPACSIRQNRITYYASQNQKEYRKNNKGMVPPNPATVWLTNIGLMGKLAKHKSFPHEVWTWSKQYLAEFLKVIMSCDGCIYAFSGHPVIEISLASEQLAKDIHHAFLRFGIVAKLKKKKAACNGKIFDAWRVEITDTQSIKTYQEEIGWIGEKASRFAEYIHVISERGGNFGHAPKEVWKTVQEDAKRQGLSLMELARRSGETTAYGKFAGINMQTKRNLPRYRLAGYAKVLGNPQLMQIASPDIYWDKIVSIEPIGEHQVYDLTVPDGSNFIAQDIIVHNSSAVLDMARHTAKKGNKVVIFSLEMSKDQLTTKIIAGEADMDSGRLGSGDIYDDEWEKILIASKQVNSYPIWVDDSTGITVAEIRTRIQRLMIQEQIDLVIIDYLQLIQPDASKNNNRVNDVSQITRDLKIMAGDLNVPVIALAQVSREVERRADKRPILSDLRESGSIEMDAAVVIFIYRDDVYNPDTESPNIAEFRVAKNRMGPTGTCQFFFKASSTTFIPIDFTQGETTE